MLDTNSISKKNPTKSRSAKLPTVKKPPPSVLKAVVKRAESKSGLAKIAARAPIAAASAVGALVKKKGYWADRKDSHYIQAAREICGRYLQDGDSVLDVGSNRTPTLEWHREKASRLVSVDLRNPYRGENVEAVTGDFFDFSSEQPFGVVTCFQVLEHIPDAHAFAQKLLAMGKTTIVSVPYNWPRGKCKYHIHDPVDEAKMMAWFEQAPIESYVAIEADRPSQRLIQVYRKAPEKPAGWTSKLVEKLDKLRKAR